MNAPRWTEIPQVDVGTSAGDGFPWLAVIGGAVFAAVAYVVFGIATDPARLAPTRGNRG